MEWVAASYALHAEPAAPDQAETHDGIGRVLRTARLKPTAWAQIGAYQFLVGLDKDDGGASWDPSQSGQGSFQTRPRSTLAASAIHETRVVKGASTTDGPAITTKSYPSGKPATRMASRSLRFARLRTTALPIRRPATSPNRTFPGSPTARTITTSPARRRRPVARTVRKLAEERSETGLSGETLAAFCTPGLEDGASSTSRHAMTEAMLAHPSSYLWLECSLHVKPRKFDRIGSVWTWKCGKGRREKVIAGGGEGQRPGCFAKKFYLGRSRALAKSICPTRGKVRFRLTIWAIDQPSELECAVLTSLPRPIHTRCPLESDFGLLPLVKCGLSRSGRGFWRQVCAWFSGLSTDVDVAVETSGAGRGLWRMGRCNLLRLLRDGRTGGASFRGPCADLSRPPIGKSGFPGSNLT
jgi:hypothetical protein